MAGIFDRIAGASGADKAEPTGEVLLSDDNIGDDPPAEKAAAQVDERRTQQGVREAVQEMLKYGLLEESHKPNLYRSAHSHTEEVARILEPLDLAMGVDEVRGLLWSTKSGHWFRFIGPLIRHQLAFCIRCSCVAADGCSNPSDSAARPPQLGLGWHSRVPASTPFSSF